MHQMSRKIGMGVLWNLANIVVSRGASLGFTLLLARLLTPEAFGLVAMVTVCFEIANVFVRSGLGQALIRSENVTDGDLNTVFWSNFFLALLAYSVLFAIAPYVASYYRQTELTTLVRVMSLSVFFNAANVVQLALLSRAMNFRTQTKANTLGVLFSGAVALTMAYQGAGVWSLVAQMLLSALLSSVVLWLSSQWRPGFQFSVESFSRLFRFGVNLLLEGMLTVAYQNSYVLVIGRLFSAEITGLYFFAKRLSSLISQQLTSSVQQATFPALSTLQNDDRVLKIRYRQIVQIMMFMVSPVMLLMAALAKPAFELFLAPKWSGAVPYLQLLCVVGTLYPLNALNMEILNVKGRSDLALKVGFLKKGVNLTLLFFGIPFGVFGILTSQVVGSFLSILPNSYLSSRLIGYGFKDQFLDALKPVLAALLASIVAAGIFRLWIYGIPMGFCLSATVAMVVYILANVVLGGEGLRLLSAKLVEYRRTKTASSNR